MDHRAVICEASAGAGGQGSLLPASGGVDATDALRGGFAAGVDGGCAPTEARAAHGEGLVRGREGAWLCGRLFEVDRLRARLACRGRRSSDAQSVRAIGLRVGRGLPVRLERGRRGSRRRVLPRPSGAHDAVRQPGVLAGVRPRPHDPGYRAQHNTAWCSIGRQWDEEARAEPPRLHDPGRDGYFPRQSSAKSSAAHTAATWAALHCSGVARGLSG